MKILIYMIRWGGGVGRVISEIKPILEKAGHEVKIISREDNLNCFSTKDAFFKIRKIVRNIPHDVLYTQDWSCAIPLLFYKNHFVCFHGENISFCSRFFQTLVGKIKENKLIVVGDKLKKRFPKSALVYNGVNFNKFKNLKKRRNKIGWIDKATEEITKIGFLNLAKKYKLKPTIAKNIPSEKMNEWYNSLKVFVSYPNKMAGFNLCWLEAKAAGVPVVLGNERGIGIKKIEKDWKNLSWENHVKKLLNLWKK